MDREHAQECPPALVIGGMHRSGTSLTASIMAAAGVHLGDELMAPAASNPKGHFEDLEFYELHQRILAAAGLSMEGFTCQAAIDVPATARAEAADLVRRRRSANRTWGWKDPRTVLFLDFWAEMVPEARWLFVVRPPEEVIDSLFRRGDTAFVVNPRHAVDVWVAYSRRILDFVRRNPERATVVDVARVVADPAGLVRRASDLLGTELTIPTSTYEPGLLKTGLTRYRTDLVRGARPEAHDLYGDLLCVGSHDRAVTTNRPPPVAEVVDAGLSEWVSACRVRADLGGIAAREADAQRMLEQTARDLEAERAAKAEVIVRADELSATVATLSNDLARERVARATLDHQVSALDAERGRLQDERDRLQDEQNDAVTRLAESDRVWEQRLAAVLAEQNEAVVRLEAERNEARLLAASALAERDEAAAELESVRSDLVATNEANRAAEEAERASFVTRFEAERDTSFAAHDAEQHDVIAALEAERDGLVAQIEAERLIHESLRLDMTGRIAAAVAGHGRTLIG